jgi:putative salt-induced outer membrane protein YdiY
VKYEYIVSETATFIQTILIEDGDENTYTESDTSLKIRIVGNLAAKMSYLLKRNSEVPSGTDKSDKITTVSLVYAF